MNINGKDVININVIKHADQICGFIEIKMISDHFKTNN